MAKLHTISQICGGRTWHIYPGCDLTCVVFRVSGKFRTVWTLELGMVQIDIQNRNTIKEIFKQAKGILVREENKPHKF